MNHVLVTGGAGFTGSYGPCQMPEKLIPVTILAALEGRPVPVYGDGGNVRDWLHKESGWRPVFEPDEGLGRTVRRYQENRWWWQAIRDGGFEDRRRQGRPDG